MEADTIAERSRSDHVSPTEGRFAVNAVIGAVVGLVLGFVPLSPAIGGAVAGYLQGGSRRAGMKVGATSGAVAAIPALLGAGLFMVTAVFGGSRASALLIVVMFLVMFVVFAGLYLVGLGAVGGWLGIYLRERQAGDRSDTGGDRSGETRTGSTDESVAEL